MSRDGTGDDRIGADRATDGTSDDRTTLGTDHEGTALSTDADGTADAVTGAAEPDGGYACESPTAPASVGSGWRATLDRTWALAAREYQLAVRRRWSLGATLVFAVFSASVVGFGASDAGPGQFDAVLVSLVELGVYLVPLVALAVGYDAIVGPHESGSLALVRSLPAPAWAVVAGTYAGRAGALGGSVLVGFAPGLVLAAVLAGPAAVGPYAVVVLAAVLAAWGFLAVGLLVSTLVRERTRALGLALGAWLWFVLLHDLLALGAVVALDLSGAGVAAAVVTNPADCFRVLALAQFDVVAGGFAAVVREAGLSVGLALAAAVGWVVGPVALAAWQMGRR